MTEHRSTFGVPKVDLEGRTFGRLFVRFQDDPVKVVHGGRTKWLITWNCRCECGNTENFSDEELTAEIRRRGWNLLLQQS